MLNTIKSYAKINLFLNVVDKLDTGFHELNSVLSRIDLYDEIRIKDESSFSISYNGPFGDQVGSNDHISKLFNYLIDKNYLKQKSFAIHVVKNIPVGSGLGGGSSNVAEIIKYLINNENVEISTLNKTLEIDDSKIKPIIKKLANEGRVNIKNKKLIEISS